MEVRVAAKNSGDSGWLLIPVNDLAGSPGFFDFELLLFLLVHLLLIHLLLVQILLIGAFQSLHVILLFGRF